MFMKLKNAPDSYEPRLMRFFRLIIRVRRLAPHDRHMWRVMDTSAFQDTEAELKRVLDNQRRTVANDFKQSK